MAIPLHQKEHIDRDEITEIVLNEVGVNAHVAEKSNISTKIGVANELVGGNTWERLNYEQNVGKEKFCGASYCLL